MKRLAGRVALVTGAARGIGRAIADRFVAEGAAVLATDLDDEGSAASSGDGEALAYHRLDVTSPDDWAAALAVLDRRFGRLDILVNNAGISRPGTIADTRDQDWRQIMETNAFGTFLGCRFAVELMSGQGGVIINIASARGRRPGSAQLAYCASKAAVLSINQSVALYCGENGLPIRCNAICPGVVQTPMLSRHAEDAGGDAAIRAMGALHVIGRVGEACEIADAAAFLASREASFITGTALDVDGGFSIRDR